MSSQFGGLSPTKIPFIRITESDEFKMEEENNASSKRYKPGGFKVSLMNSQRSGVKGKMPVGYQRFVSDDKSPNSRKTLTVND